MKPCPHRSDCKIKYEMGKGSFIGYKLKLCHTHQIIIAMKRGSKANDPNNRDNTR